VGRALAKLATAQHGVVSVGQLRALGLDRSAVRRRVLAGHLHPLHRGVYAMGHRALSVCGTYLAAVLAAGPGAVLSHRAAGHLWGLRAGAAGVTVTIPRHRAGPRNVKVHQSRVLGGADVTEREGIPVTTVARTLLDLAGVVSARDLARAVDTAERHELFDLTAMEGVLSRARGRRGAAALRRAIAAWQPRHTRSELEDRFAELMARSPLPPPDLNVLLDGQQSQHEIDAFWPSQGLVVQLDGFAFHRTRRDRERDAATDADLELAGLRVVRLTWEEVTRHADRTVRRLAVIFAGR
jgi:predicted transcriptional regulator of viral defense system